MPQKQKLQLTKTLLLALLPRGVEELEAKSLLIEAFAFEAFSTLNDDGISEFTRNILAEWLYTERQMS